MKMETLEIQQKNHKKEVYSNQCLHKRKCTAKETFNRVNKQSIE